MLYSSLDYRELDSVALQLRIDYGFNGYKIDVFELARKLGIIIIPYSKLSNFQRNYINQNKKLEDGFSIRKETSELIQWHIFYNDGINFFRQRFTIAHEIKHVVFGETNPSEKDEILANHFARYLLAPTCLVMDFINSPLGPKDVFFAFDISLEAANNAFGAAISRCNSNFRGFTKLEKDFLSLCKTK